MRHTSWRMVAGVRGDISDYWSYDLYGLYAEVQAPNMYVNDFHEDRILDSILIYGDPDDEDIPILAYYLPISPSGMQINPTNGFRREGNL